MHARGIERTKKGMTEQEKATEKQGQEQTFQKGSAAFSSGILAGFASTVVLHPLDLIKTRFQVDESFKRTSFWERIQLRSSGVGRAMGGAALTARSIHKELGLLGLYRGVVPALLGSCSSWGLYFLFYENIKFRVSEQETRRLSSLEYLCASATAGAMTTFFTNPIWLIKTRMELQSPGNEPYKGVVHAVRTIFREEGAAGFYKGIIPALFLVSNGAVQWMVYEELKHFVGGPMGPKEYMVLGALSKGIASTVTYPYQVVKSRMQQHKSKYHSTWQTLRAIHDQGGLFALYRGLVPNLLRVMPSSAITVAVYEMSRKFLS